MIRTNEKERQELCETSHNLKANSKLIHSNATIFDLINQYENLTDIMNNLDSIKFDGDKYEVNYTIDEMRLNIDLPIDDTVVSGIPRNNIDEIAKILANWSALLIEKQGELKNKVIKELHKKHMLVELAHVAEIYLDERLLPNSAYCISLYDSINEREDILEFVIYFKQVNMKINSEKLEQS